MRVKFNKKTFYQIHTWIGLKLSILLFVICFSGTLATLSNEMDWLFFPESRAQIKDNKVSHNKRVTNIKELYPEGRIVLWNASKEPYLCDRVQVLIDDKLTVVFVNQYTGEVQGSTRLTFQYFFRSFHYFLFIPLKIGHYTVLIFGFILFVSTITALLFYKKWWRKLFKLNVGKGKVAFYKSLHKLVGSWSIPFCIFFSVTGIWYFLERTNIGGIGSICNTKRPEIESIELDDTAFSKLSYNVDYDKVIRVAEQAIPGLKVMDVIFPKDSNKAIYLTGTSDVILVRNRANQVFIHPLTYEVIETKNARDSRTVIWLNDIVDPLHFGYWGGLTTKIIWFIGGLAISSLILSGIWTLLKRKIGRKKSVKTKWLKFWRCFDWVTTVVVFLLMHATLVIGYAVPIKVHLIVTLFWGVFLFLGWYIYVYKLKRL